MRFSASVLPRAGLRVRGVLRGVLRALRARRARRARDVGSVRHGPVRYRVRALLIISTTYVSEKHKTSMTVQLHM